MKHTVVLMLFLLLISSCGKKSSSAEDIQAEQSATTVTLTHAKYGHVETEITLQATTAYLGKSVVSSPVAVFITAAYVQPGSRVCAGQVLYRIESKEQHALGGVGQKDIPVTAGRSGIVLDVQQQAGSYVPEGTVLCTIADAGSLVFEINVPYEQRRLARSGGHCLIELPDGTRFSASISTPLAMMNTASQSEKVIARARTSFLPEGMNVKAIFTRTGGASGQSLVLPKSAVQSDETLTEHWVMKLAANGTAVKIPVETGNSNSTQIEVKSSALTPEDKIIMTGGYGLEDGAKVVVAKGDAGL